MKGKTILRPLQCFYIYITFKHIMKIHICHASWLILVFLLFLFPCLLVSLFLFLFCFCGTSSCLAFIFVVYGYMMLTCNVTYLSCWNTYRNNYILFLGVSLPRIIFIYILHWEVYLTLRIPTLYSHILQSENCTYLIVF